MRVYKRILYVCIQYLFRSVCVYVSMCNWAEALQTESNAYGIGLHRHRLCVILTLTSVYWDPQGTITPSNTHIHRTITAWSQGETEDNLRHTHTHTHTTNYTNIGRDENGNETERKDSERSEKDGGDDSRKKKSNKRLTTGSDVRWREGE